MGRFQLAKIIWTSAIAIAGLAATIWTKEIREFFGYVSEEKPIQIVIPTTTSNKENIEPAKSINPETNEALASIVVGVWSGKLDDKKLIVHIESCVSGVLSGFDIAGSNRRPFTGVCSEIRNDVVRAILTEPGGQKWDGEFSIEFMRDGGDWIGVGTFRSFDGKLNRVVKVKKE